MRMRSRFPSPRALQLTAAAGALLVLILSLNAAPFFRLDLTDEKVYSLSPGSEALIRSLEAPVDIKLYVSKSLAELPPVLQAHGRRVEEFLREFTGQSRGQLRLELVDPQPDSDDSIWASKYGVRSLPLGNGASAYLGAVFLAGDREVAVPFFDPRKEDLLEYEVAEALAKLQKTEDKKLGIYSPLPVGVAGQGAGGGREWIFLNRLRDFYELEVFASPPRSIPDDISVFILMHPEEADASLEYAIDQFVLRGGRLVLMLDPFSRFQLEQNWPESAPQPPEVSPRSSQLPRLLAHWGVSFDAETVIANRQQATRVENAGLLRENPAFLSLGAGDLARESVITSSLRQLLWVEGGAFDANGVKSGLSWEPLIQSGAETGLLPHTRNSQADPEGAAAAIGQDRKKRALAGLLRGRFSSAFAEPPPGSEHPQSFHRESRGENVVLLVADSDFLQDVYAIEPLQIGDQWVQKPRNDNINFLTNALAYLAGSSEIMRVRSSGRVQRPFTRLREIQETALTRWQAEEQTLSRELNSLAQEIAALQAAEAKGEGSAESGRVSAGVLEKLRADELRLRGQRREVRRKLREDIDALGYRLKALNLLCLPGLLSVAGLIVYRRRYRS